MIPDKWLDHTSLFGMNEFRNASKVYITGQWKFQPIPNWDSQLGTKVDSTEGKETEDLLVWAGFIQMI